MGTFRYYKPNTPALGPFGWFAYTAIIGTIWLGCLKLERYEDIEDIGPLRNKTYLYHNYHTDVAKHPNRETFKRIA